MRRAVVRNVFGSNPHSNGDLFRSSLIFFEISVVKPIIAVDTGWLLLLLLLLILLFLLFTLFSTNFLVGSQVYLSCIR